jgi:hypothetical protein
MGTVSAPIPFAGSQLGAERHVCAFFRNADEEYQVLLPFIKDGFDTGDRAFHIVDPKRRNEHLRRLTSAGIDVAVAERKGQLKLYDWHDTYFRHGRFDQHAMLALIEAELQDGARQGFRLSRSIGHMEWALEDRPGVQDVVEYEARLNYILPRYKDPVICVYDLARFGGAIVVDMLRTHPMVIIGGILQENPFFVPPDEFLRDSSKRRTAD